MKPKQQTYNSLHDYLETALKSIPNPTDMQVMQAKGAYWKWYYARYRREKRKIRKEFTLGFDKQRLQLIYQKKGNLSVSEFLYQCMELALDNNQIVGYDKKLLGSIDHHLMQLIDLLEELLETKGTDMELQEKIEKLEARFHQLFITAMP